MVLDCRSLGQNGSSIFSELYVLLFKTCFFQVVEGMDVLHEIDEHCGSQCGHPTHYVSNCSSTVKIVASNLLKHCSNCSNIVQIRLRLWSVEF